MARRGTHQGDVPAAPWLAVTGDVVVRRSPSGCDDRLRRLLADAALSFGNLEVPLTTRGTPAEKAITHRADPKLSTDLRDLGFDVLTLANNHALDFGVDGMHDTVAALADAGLAAVGAGNDASEALRPLHRSTAGGTVALLGLCAALPPGFAAGAARPGVAPLRVLQQVSVDPALAAEQPGMAPFVHTRAHGPDLDAACSAVREASRTADIVVVAVHWGVPLGFAAASYGVLAEYQRPAGRALVDAGADVVVGHHPHAVQPVEEYRGGLIAYSVGNYVFHDWDAVPSSSFPMQVPAAPYRSPFGAAETRDSVIVTIDRDDEGSLVVGFVPTTMADGDPVVPAPEHASAILRRLVEPALEQDGGGTVPTVHVHDGGYAGMTVGEVSLARRS